MTRLETPFYAIVIIARNDRIGLQKTVESALLQTFSDYELVIVDGDSSDGTLQYLETLRDPRIKWKCKPDRGIYDAMNKGILRSTGKWLIFLNAGDVFASPTILEVLQPYLEQGVAVVYGDYNVEGTSRWARPMAYLERWGMMTSHQSVLFNRTVCGHILYYDCSFRVCADFDLICRIQQRHPGAYCYTGQVIASVESGGVSVQKYIRIRSEQLLIVSRYFGLRGTANYFGEAARKSVRRLFGLSNEYCPPKKRQEI